MNAPQYQAWQRTPTADPHDSGAAPSYPDRIAHKNTWDPDGITQLANNLHDLFVQASERYFQPIGYGVYRLSISTRPAIAGDYAIAGAGVEALVYTESRTRRLPPFGWVCEQRLQALERAFGYLSPQASSPFRQLFWDMQEKLRAQRCDSLGETARFLLQITTNAIAVCHRCSGTNQSLPEYAELLLQTSSRVQPKQGILCIDKQFKRFSFLRHTGTWGLDESGHVFTELSGLLRERAAHHTVWHFASDSQQDVHTKPDPHAWLVLAARLLRHSPGRFWSLWQKKKQQEGTESSLHQNRSPHAVLLQALTAVAQHAASSSPSTWLILALEPFPVASEACIGVLEPPPGAAKQDLLEWCIWQTGGTGQQTGTAGERRNVDGVWDTIARTYCHLGAIPAPVEPELSGFLREKERRRPSQQTGSNTGVHEKKSSARSLAWAAALRALETGYKRWYSTEACLNDICQKRRDCKAHIEKIGAQELRSSVYLQRVWLRLLLSYTEEMYVQQADRDPRLGLLFEAYVVILHILQGHSIAAWGPRFSPSYYALMLLVEQLMDRIRRGLFIPDWHNRPLQLAEWIHTWGGESVTQAAFHACIQATGGGIPLVSVRDFPLFAPIARYWHTVSPMSRWTCEAACAAVLQKMRAFPS